MNRFVGKYFLLIIILFSFDSYAIDVDKVLNNSDYDVHLADINNDGIDDLFVIDTKSDDAYIFFNRNDDYIFKYKLNNHLEDGMYFFKNVSYEKNKDISFSITTEFFNSGAENKKYFYGVEDGKLNLVQLVSFDDIIKNNMHYKKICISKMENHKLICYLDNSKEALGKYFVSNFHYISEESIEKTIKHKVVIENRGFSTK